MKTEREARLRAQLAQEADFLRRQQLMKELWRLTQQGDDVAGQTDAQPNKAATSTAAHSSRDEHSPPRVAV